MGIKATVVLLVGLVLASVHLADAQQSKVPRIGFLSAQPIPAIADHIKAFREGSSDLGYVEQRNIIIGWRSGEGKPDLLGTVAAELVRLNVDIIVTGGPAATRPVKEITSTIPIVMGQDSDPVGNGFVTSLARPGGNITGLSSLTPEISGKRLELLKETIPKISRVAVLGNSAVPENAQALKETEIAAGALGIKLQYLDVRDSKDIGAAFQAASKGRVDAVLALPGPVLSFLSENR